MGINGRGHKGWKPLQVGVREKLLCEDCEQLLNDKYEKPFQEQWKPPIQISHESAHSALYDYTSFKLFHLSILFRSSISSLTSFREVNLGVHEERIRQLLLSEQPGEHWEYPIFAFLVLNDRSEIERRLIACPTISRFEGHVTYAQIYGGAMWWVSVSSHLNSKFCQSGLQPTGEIKMVAKSWNEIGVIQKASQALKRAQSPRNKGGATL